MDIPRFSAAKSFVRKKVFYQGINRGSAATFTLVYPQTSRLDEKTCFLRCMARGHTARYCLRRCVDPLSPPIIPSF